MIKRILNMMLRLAPSADLLYSERVMTSTCKSIVFRLFPCLLIIASSILHAEIDTGRRVGVSRADIPIAKADGSKRQRASKSAARVKHENTTGGRYWITGSTGKTHRKGCRWYGNTQYGHYSNKGSGDNCKKCGGAGR